LPPGDTDGVPLGDTDPVIEADVLIEPDSLSDGVRDREEEGDGVMEEVPEMDGLWVDESDIVGELVVDCVTLKLALSETVGEVV